MTSIDALHASRVNTRIHKVLSDLRGLNAHVDFLASTGTASALDGRDVLRCAGEAKAFAIQLHHELEYLADLARSVTRRGLGDSYGAFQSNFRGALKPIAAEFDKLNVRIRALDAVGSEKMNDPGRWGDAAAPSEVADLFSLIGTLLDLWRLERVRQRLAIS